MTPERLRRIQELFHAASGLEDSERAPYLERCCAGDASLLRAVKDMLAARPYPPLRSEPATQTEAAWRGPLLGSYRIENKLGEGGMGEVFRAVDTRLSRPVAVKVCRESFSERFQREALALSVLNHPHICTLFDVGPNYLVMELVEGDTLAGRIRQGPLDLDAVLSYGIEIAEALAEAHSRGVVHRDLKPGNIMITRHGVKVLDFGLAKISSEASMTQTNVVIGTPAYMAPEQMAGAEEDARTDLFALGLVLYEMGVGTLPLPGVSLGRLLLSGPHQIDPPSRKRGAIPKRLDLIVTKLLQREPGARYQSAAELLRDLRAVADSLHRKAPARRRGPWIAAAAVLAVVLAAGVAVYRRADHRRWAREDAIPQIANLKAERKPVAALRLLREASPYLPGDPELGRIERTLVRTVSLGTTPAGARVEIQDYLAPHDPWLPVDAGPSTALPTGYFRWRISKPGFETLTAAPITADKMQFMLQPSGSDTRTVHVAGGGWTDLIGFVGWLHSQLPAFDIDRYEVTNAEFQKFVDSGGYRRKEFWNHKFVKDGRELTWEEAMQEFRDPTGRPGPSTWEGGHYPDGRGDLPVSGISWYEAAAYAESVGRSLPAISQWYKVAPEDVDFFSINESNFNGRGPVKGGSLPDEGPYGTYDMAGNVREWCWNEVDGGLRFILGGAWGTQTYQAYDPEALSPFDRSSMNGFRTVKNAQPLPADASGPLTRKMPDFSRLKPVSDEVFNAFKTSTYGYDRTPLNAAPATRVEETADWIKEQTSIDAGYSGERLPVYLFLPKNVRRPFQSVVFFPSARVNTMASSKNLGDLEFVDYIVQSGRALIYPIYRGTYERATVGQALPGTINDLQLVVQQSKEVRRTLDYLESRPDTFDAAKIAYLGVSQGAAYGPIFAALDHRFQTFILLDGGYFLDPALPARDQVNFVPRVHKPVLMVNGKYDFTFPVDRAQNPMFQMLGTPPSDKRHVVLDTPHDVSQERPALSREVLAWLDKYLGKIN